MRKLTFLITMILVAALASGCNLSFNPGATAAEPTLTDMQMQTQISTLLTAQPTTTLEPKAPVTATAQLPTVEPTVEPPTAEAPTQAPEAEATATLEAPTATVEAPTATVEAQQDSQSGGGGPTPTAPPTLTPVSGTPAPTATTSPGDPRNRLGNPSSSDGMDDATDWVWPTGVSEFTSVNFTNGSMLLTSLDDISGWRLANPAGREFSSLYLEATVRTGTCQGNDQYGIIARVPVLKDADQGYLLGFTCDGRYSFRSWDGKVGEKGKMTRLVDWTANPAINAGSGQTNRMGLMMVGSRMYLYANGTLLTELSSSTYASGYFGLFVGGMQTKNFAITVDEMSYWENPKP